MNVEIARALRALEVANGEQKEALEHYRKTVKRVQEACKHLYVDASIFGDTCNDCGLYLNNGI
jgi:hypothetical protein